MTFALVADHAPLAASSSGLAAFSEAMFADQSRHKGTVTSLQEYRNRPISYRVANDQSGVKYFEKPATIGAHLDAVGKEAKAALLSFGDRIAASWRENLLWQLDALLDPDEWDETGAGNLMSVPSWKCFLRGLFVLRSERLPGLGLTDAGFVVASWARGAQHIDIEFKPDDQARWVLAAEIEDGIERVAGRTSIFRLPEVLAPYSPDRWFAA